MSVRTNRFLTSTCLGFLGLSFFVIPSPAFAGFEWTPPEKQVATPLPKPSSVSDFSDESSGLPEVEDVEIMEESEPPVVEDSRPPHTDGRLKVKVITPQEEEPQILEGGVEVQDDQSTVMSAPVIPKGEVEEPAPEPFPITETHQGMDAVMPEPAESVSEPAKEPPAGLNINPYPLEGEPTEPALTAAPAQPEEITWKGGDYPVIEGFGSDMPLALALRQVVPAEYAFSFGRGVNPGYLVSWEGGKPWNLVLGDMLRPLNIKAVVQGNVVKVVSMVPGEAVPVPASAPPAAEDSAALAPLPEAAPAEDVVPVKAEKKAEKLSKKEAKKLAEEAKALEEKAQAEAPVEAALAEEPAAKEPVKVASAPVAAPAPEVKKAPGRNVILDPGDVKPSAPAAQEAAEEPSEDEVEKLVLAETDDATPPSDEALKPAAEPEKKDEGQKKSTANEQMFQPRIWEAKQGSSLRETLDSWSKQANVALEWKTDKDYTLSSNILISGTFDNAVKVLFAQAVKNGPMHNLTSGPQAALVIGEAASG